MTSPSNPDTVDTVDVVFFVFDGIQGLDLTGPHDAFDGANRVLADLASDRPRYRLSVVSLDGAPVSTESGLRIATTPVADVVGRISTLAIPGGAGTRIASNDPAVVAAVADLASRADRTITICTGAFVAAAAGVLDGRRVTTHWARSGALDERFPAVDVDPEPIYIQDGPIWSSAGVTAGIDLALAVVEQDHDAEVAQIVARWLVMFLRRPGGQSQFATPVWTQRATAEPIRLAQELVDAAPGGDHRVGLLAERVGMSERHFTRRFAEQVGVSPAQYVAAVRIEAARRALETTGDTVEAIAQRCGFGTGETMRRTFARRIGASPDQYQPTISTPHQRTEHTVSIQAVIPLFDRFTALDGIGPYEVLQRIPEIDVTFIGHEVGEVRSENGFLGITRDATFEDIPNPDVIVFPGGVGTRPLVDDERVVDWVRAAHPTTRFTTSVCTGSLVLGAAGLLDGLSATTHWGAYDALERTGAIPTAQRVVEHLDRRIITAAGVSSGIDMALRLVELLIDRTAAEAAQLMIEYDPQPPFDAGAVDKAGPGVMQRVIEYAEHRQ